MNLLIVTEPDDAHAAVVKLALEAKGHPVRLLFTADLPTMQKNSIYIENGSYLWKCCDKEAVIVENNYDVVWWRRARKPFLPKTEIHPDDYQFTVRENHFFYESLTNNIAPHAFWINSKESAVRANSKLLQLKMAGHCGLTIPTTLCSNDPKDIRYFLLKHEQEGVIYKPLSANIWYEQTQMRLSYTAKIKFLELPDNKTLQLTPGIFQKEIQKKYELRVVCFGDYLVAAKLHSQQHAEGLVDWRAIPQGKMSIEPYTLPTEVAKRIRAFMQRLGLVFGSLDFIVTTENEYIFLEVNEQGQFFWVEEQNPEIKMLDIFVHFICAKSAEFTWNPKKAAYKIDDFRADVHTLVANNLKHHVERNSALAQQ